MILRFITKGSMTPEKLLYNLFVRFLQNCTEDYRPLPCACIQMITVQETQLLQLRFADRRGKLI
jgi:hypothetical protein